MLLFLPSDPPREFLVGNEGMDALIAQDGIASLAEYGD